MITWPKKFRGYSGLPSRDNIHIYRDPSSSKYTRKKERIEYGDIKSLIEEDPQRYSDSIKKWAKSVNPAVEVSYQNSNGGSHLTTMTNVEAKYPYRVLMKGQFRPPMYRQEDLLPLSRMNRSYFHISGVPAVRGSYTNCGLAESIDQQPVISSTSVIVASGGPILPTRSYIIQNAVEMCSDQNIKEDRHYDTILSSKTSTTPKAEYFDDEFAKDIHSQHTPYATDKNNLVKSESSMPSTKLYDLPEMNDREVNSGIKEFTLLENLYSNPSIDNLVYNKNFNVNGINEDNMNIQGSTMPSNINKLQRLSMEYELDRKNELISASSVPSNKNRLQNTYNPVYELERNLNVDKLASPVNIEYHMPGESRLAHEYKMKIGEQSGETNISHFIKRDHEELMMEKREKTKLKKETHYNDFGAKPNNFTMDRQGLVVKMKR